MVSSAVALIFFVLLAAKAFVWAVIAFIASFVLSLVLDWARDDKIQQWLDRIVWGRLTEQRYESEKIEQQELQKALGMA